MKTALSAETPAGIMLSNFFGVNATRALEIGNKSPIFIELANNFISGEYNSDAIAKANMVAGRLLRSTNSITSATPLTNTVKIADSLYRSYDAPVGIAQTIALIAEEFGHLTRTGGNPYDVKVYSPSNPAEAGLAAAQAEGVGVAYQYAVLGEINDGLGKNFLASSSQYQDAIDSATKGEVAGTEAWFAKAIPAATEVAGLESTRASGDGKLSYRQEAELKYAIKETMNDPGGIDPATVNWDLVEPSDFLIDDTTIPNKWTISTDGLPRADRFYNPA